MPTVAMRLETGVLTTLKAGDHVEMDCRDDGVVIGVIRGHKRLLLDKEANGFTLRNIKPRGADEFRKVADELAAVISAMCGLTVFSIGRSRDGRIEFIVQDLIV